MSDLPARGTEEARTLFFAMYQSRFGTHPASPTWRRDRTIADTERELWRQLIDRIEPARFAAVFDDIERSRFSMDRNDRRDKPTLSDVRASWETVERHYQPPHPPEPELGGLTISEWLQTPEGKAANGETVARLRARVAGQAMPPVRARPVRGDLRPIGDAMDAAIAAEDAAERAAIQSVEAEQERNREPW